MGGRGAGYSLTGSGQESKGTKKKQGETCSSKFN